MYEYVSPQLDTIIQALSDGTLNLSDVPTVMVELGNMRSASEARVMTSPSGRARYARGLVSGVRRFLG